MSHNSAQQDSTKNPVEIETTDYARGLLEIGGYDGNDFYLLDPFVVTENGEWKAYMYGNESGVFRYNSFWDMMQHTYFLSFVNDFPFP